MFKLRALCEKDVDGMLEWMHSEASKAIFQKDMSSITREQALDFIKSAAELSFESNSIHYACVDEKDEYLGTISLKNIDSVNRNAEYAVSFRKKAQGTGAALYATKEILRIAFEDIKLHSVYLNVLNTNQRANAFYKKSGFVYEGTSRENLFINGEFKSLNWYSIIESEYKY